MSTGPVLPGLPGWLSKLVVAVVVAIIVTLVCILLGSILADLKVDIAVTIGKFLQTWATVLGVLAGLIYFFGRP